MGVLRGARQRAPGDVDVVVFGRVEAREGPGGLVPGIAGAYCCVPSKAPSVVPLGSLCDAAPPTVWKLVVSLLAPGLSSMLSKAGSPWAPKPPEVKRATTASGEEMPAARLSPASTILPSGWIAMAAGAGDAAEDFLAPPPLKAVSASRRR